MIASGPHNRFFDGDSGDDSLTGGDGNDELEGGYGDDTLDGRRGNDSLIGDLFSRFDVLPPGADTVSGGPGNDFLYLIDEVSGNDSGDGGQNKKDHCEADAGDIVIRCEN